MSARRIPRQRRSVSGLFWSQKNGGQHIPYESGLELDFCTVLELDDAVQCFESQPLAVTYVRQSGRICRGFPDFLVTFAPGTGRPIELVDVKPRSKLHKDWVHLKPRLKAACGYARSRGWLFRLKTETEIRTPFLNNAKYLLRYLRDGADPAHEAHLVAALGDLAATTIGTLLETTYPNREARAAAIPTLWNLIARRIVHADLNGDLNLKSNIRLRGI
jgi:hypothetical protein